MIHNKSTDTVNNIKTVDEVSSKFAVEEIVVPLPSRINLTRQPPLTRPTPAKAMSRDRGLR